MDPGKVDPPPPQTPRGSGFQVSCRLAEPSCTSAQCPALLEASMTLKLCKATGTPKESADSPLHVSHRLCHDLDISSVGISGFGALLRLKTRARGDSRRKLEFWCGETSGCRLLAEPVELEKDSMMVVARYVCVCHRQCHEAKQKNFSIWNSRCG